MLEVTSSETIAEPSLQEQLCGMRPLNTVPPDDESTGGDDSTSDGTDGGTGPGLES